MTPLIREVDYNTLNTLLRNLMPTQKTKEISQLKTELDRAQIVADNALPSDTIRLNSYFEVEEETSGRLMKFTLTLPGQADLAKQKISVLSPLGVALIGFRENMTIPWVLPGGPKRLKIVKVVNA